MSCKCGGKLDYTLVQDISTKIYLISCCCDNCGKTETAYGFTAQEALDNVEKKFNEIPKRRNNNVR